MLPEDQLRAALLTLPSITVPGPWARVVDYAALQGPTPGAPTGTPAQSLWSGGSLRSGGRFTPPGAFEALYLALDLITALIEAGEIFLTSEGPPLLPAAVPKAYFRVEGILTDVLDLTDPSVRAGAGTSPQELTGTWRYRQSHGELAPTQILGRLAYESGRFKGLQSISAKNSNTGRVLVVFTDRLGPPPSFIEVRDPAGYLTKRLP